jgi:predicted nucleic acid-binding protein
MLEREIHVGEAEALVLAVEAEADWVLLDERAARDVAETLGLSYMGLLGVLARAKRDRLIPSIRPLLDALRAHGFWVSDALYEYVLAQMGEAP